MNQWRRRLIEALGGTPNEDVPLTGGTFVLDAEIERAEELRVDRLGPSEVDLPVDRDRPENTLGVIP